jgi:hypothetical protein
MEWWEEQRIWELKLEMKAGAEPRPQGAQKSQRKRMPNAPGVLCG